METSQEKTSRRDILKKAGKSALFIAPVLMSFKVSEVKANNSELPNGDLHF